MNRIQSLDKHNQLSDSYKPPKNYSKTINYIISPPGLERHSKNQNNYNNENLNNINNNFINNQNYYIQQYLNYQSQIENDYYEHVYLKKNIINYYRNVKYLEEKFINNQINNQINNNNINFNQNNNILISNNKNNCDNFKEYKLFESGFDFQLNYFKENHDENQDVNRSSVINNDDNIVKKPNSKKIINKENQEEIQEENQEENKSNVKNNDDNKKDDEIPKENKINVKNNNNQKKNYQITKEKSPNNKNILNKENKSNVKNNDYNKQKKDDEIFKEKSPNKKIIVNESNLKNFPRSIEECELQKRNLTLRQILILKKKYYISSSISYDIGNYIKNELKIDYSNKINVLNNDIIREISVYNWKDLRKICDYIDENY